MFVERCELNDYYKKLYNKDFPNSTLSKWKKENRISWIPDPLKKQRFLYSLEEFQEIVSSDEYAKKLKASKESPNNYLGKQQGHLLIKAIVPDDEKENKDYKGTMMYCKCLKCNRPDLIQVRFTYLTSNGNYIQTSCGCGRKERAFIASSREGITEDFINRFDNFEYYLFVHKFLTSTTDKYYLKCDIEKYQQAIEYFYYNNQLKQIYLFWENNKNNFNQIFYDWSKPSLDHKIPKSRGGSSSIENLQALTVFENLAKRDMTQEEWDNFKKTTNTYSDYFIENIIKEEG